MMARTQSAIVLVILACVLIFVIQQSGAFTATRLLQVDDYTEYWAAGRLNMTQGDPYDPTQLLPLQLEVGRTEGVPVMMWNPPYTLALAMPLALLPYPTSRVIWFLVTLTSVAISARWLWLDYLGSTADDSLVWAALGIAFSFYPTFALLQTGQIGGLLLLGFTGFLHFEGRREFVSGVFAALMAIKPHVMYLFWVFLCLRALLHWRWKEPLAALGSLAVATAITTAVNPPVLRHYLAAVATHPPTDWATPTLGGLLRWALRYERVYLQFLPVILGLAWLGLEWRRHGYAWEWRREAPLLALISVVTAAYGWSSDKVVLIVAPISIAVSLLNSRRLTVSASLVCTSYLAVMCAAFWRHSGANDLEYAWFGPVILLWYVFALRGVRPKSLAAQV